MPKTHAQWEQHKPDYIGKIEEQIKAVPRYTVATGTEKFQSNDAAGVLDWLDKNVKPDINGKTLIRTVDHLRRVDQMKGENWYRFDRAGIAAWLAEATHESAAQDLYRRDCVEEQRAEALGGK
jgi:hypothetical protein